MCKERGTLHFDHSLWGEIVPDGSRFCHWGGKALSEDLGKRLNLSSTDRVLDQCCGEGGLTDYLGSAKSVIGIDISAEAISQARLSVQHRNIEFVIADARQLPFPDSSFTKVVSQDADVWMNADKVALMREIARVMMPGGMFLWQSYVTNEQCQEKTKRLLSLVGYSACDMPQQKNIGHMFKESGFEVNTIESFHDIYVEDNLRMLVKGRSLQSSASACESVEYLVQLLEWERRLFERRLWSGVLVTAYKCSGV